MATAQTAPRAINDQIRLEYGVAQEFALKFVTGKEVHSKFPGGRYMFTSVDHGPLFLDGEDAADFEAALRKLAVQPGELLRVLKVKHPHGGGHSIRVALASDPGPGQIEERPPTAPQPGTEELLERSIRMAKPDGSQPPAAAPDQPGQVVITPASMAMCAAMCSAVDAILETQAYATRRGLGLTFSEESVRAIGLSIYIGGQRK